MATFASLQDLKTHLIRKALTGSVFVAEATASHIEDELTELTGEAPNQTHELVALPAGFHDLGYTTAAGAAFNTETTTSDVDSWQSVSPTRSDVTARTTTLQVVAQETKAATLAVYNGIAMAGLEAAAGTGDLIIKEPQRPTERFYHVLALAQDEDEMGEYFLGRYLPRAKVTGRGGQAFDKSDNAIGYDVTFTGFFDSTYGTAQSYLYGGSGWLARLEDMGIEQAA
jgi:hypothetical protein